MNGSTTEGLCRATGEAETCASVLGANFGSTVHLVTGTSPTMAALADLNGDGKLDLAVVNYASTTVSVFLNATAANATTPSFAAKKDFPTGSGPRYVAVGDFNGDGKPDLAVANQIATTVGVLINTTPTGATSPSFAAGVEFTTGSGVPSVVVGDFNGDGKPDLAVGNSSSGTISVLLNTAATGAAMPSFAPKVDLTAGPQDSGLDLAIGDLDGDGRPDLAVTSYSTRTISAFINATTPNAATATFATRSDIPDQSGPAAVAIGDLNGDGRPDLVVANYDASTISVLANTTATAGSKASFADPVELTAGIGDPSVAIADLNGDGQLDLALTNSGTAAVAVFVNTTARGATPPSMLARMDFATGDGPGFVAAGDLDGDGRPDLVVVRGLADDISILLAR